MLRELLIAYSRRDFCTENILFYIAYHNLAQRCAEYWVQQLIPQSDSNSLSDQSLNSGEEPMEQSAADIISVVRDLSTAQMGGVHAPNPDMYPYEPQRIATVSAAASISGFNHHPNSTNPEVSSSQFVLPPLALPNMDLAAAVNAVLDSWIAPAHALSNTARHRYSRNPASPHFRMPAQQVPESLVGQFIEIFDLFFKPGSELELNLPQEKMRTVRKHFAAMMEHGLGMKVLPNQKSSKVKTGKLSPMPWDVLTPPRSITHDPLPSHVIRTPGTQMDYGMQSEYGETMELQRMHQHSRDYHRQSEYSTPTTIVPSQPQTPWYVPPPPPMTAMRGERNWGDGRMHLEHAGPTVPVVPSRRQNTLYEPSVNEYGGDHEWGARSESAWSRAASTAEIRQVRHEPSWSSGGRGGHDVHTYAQNGQTDNEDFVTHSVAIPIPSAKQQQYPAPVNSVPTAAKLQVLMDVFDASKVDVVDMLYENTFLKFVRELESGTVLA
ncbi:hypothetical protein BJ742DRAFT_518285 [Cladochytrium replicatum]|nr:hypothetical protein BJ742DRAFT_518285 [Cladochytrium replicatum]